MDSRPSTAAGPVCSHNEWDPLEEVIVGIVDDAMFPSWNTINKVTVPPGEWDAIDAMLGHGGVPYPTELVRAAQDSLAELVQILSAAGVVVRRPETMSFAAPYASPDWAVSNGFCAANPRDVFLVVGDEIIEAPMADRGRYFESWPYRGLIKEYFRAGARWTAAPKPQLFDSLYDADYRVPSGEEPMRFLLTEFEPVFDAADFVRCGRDLFGQLSHTTNALGIAWLRRHLGPGYRVHLLESQSPQAMHIDSTFIPLAPGKVLVNPAYLDLAELPLVLKDWEVLVAPEPVYTQNNPFGPVSGWINMNVLSLDKERVVVEKSQQPMIRALEGWGFTPIACNFEPYYVFAGSFHCATLDIRRRGTLQSYF